MRITTLHYERKRSDGNFGNRSLSITAEVDEDDDKVLVIESIAGLVRARLDQDEREEEEERRRHEEEQRARYTREREARLAQNGDHTQVPDDDDEDDDEEERGPHDDGEYLPF